jgi:hypothetical protein
VTRNANLPPPGSLKLSFSIADTDAMIAIGMSDASARVRERAIVCAYGTGRVEAHAPAVIRAATEDPSERVRVFALVALGLLRDPESHAILARAFADGTDAEVDAAVWALARRPDGIAQVVAAVEDPRPQVRPEAIGAIANVAIELDDVQLAWLRATAREPIVREAAEYHVERVRRGIAR